MADVKKVYTIEITEINSGHLHIWYANKKGRKYTAELKAGPVSGTGSSLVVFMVNPCQWVHLTDCKIIFEQIKPIYQPNL